MAACEYPRIAELRDGLPMAAAGKILRRELARQAGSALAMPALRLIGYGEGCTTRALPPPSRMGSAIASSWPWPRTCSAVASPG